MDKLLYLIAEGIKNIWRHKMTTFTAVFSLFLALYFVGFLAIAGENTKSTYGSPFTFVGYHGAWVQEEFWKAFINTSLICFFVVLTSLTIGTLGAYALSRSNYKYTF